MHREVSPTCSENLLYLDAVGVYFLGELMDGLVGVLVREGVNVYLDPWGAVPVGHRGEGDGGGLSAELVRPQVGL